MYIGPEVFEFLSCMEDAGNNAWLQAGCRGGGGANPLTGDCLGFGLDAASMGANFLPISLAGKAIIGGGLFAGGLTVNAAQGDVIGGSLDGTAANVAVRTGKTFTLISGVQAFYSANQCYQSLR